ncbi:lytic murein transglycosylase [Limnohabitans sp. B9-3]|uniref:lytic murein transglycosylase n=1 Tax=Limnohabitans sp. B9-3 TaxID=1100707 RepID=UPI00117B9E46
MARTLAADFDRDSQIDLGNSCVDAIGLVVNDFKAFGWQTGSCVFKSHSGHCVARAAK